MFIILSVKTTFPDRESAILCANILLKEKLIACANLIPCESIYTWQNEHINENEVILTLKTIEMNQEIISNRLQELHSYEVPLILFSKYETHMNYFNWVRSCCKSSIN